MKWIFNLLLLFIAVTAISSNGQTRKKNPSFKDCFIGSAIFLLGDLATKNKPDFIDPNLGNPIIPKNIVALAFITWKYACSLGIPQGVSCEAPTGKLSGYMRSYSIA